MPLPETCGDDPPYGAAGAVDIFDPEVQIKYLDADLRIGECDIVGIRVAGSFLRNMEFDVQLATRPGAGL